MEVYTDQVKFKSKRWKMELFLKIPLKDYEIKEFEDTGTIVIVKKRVIWKARLLYRERRFCGRVQRWGNIQY